MGKFYTAVKLSNRISKTPEGFLVCEGVPIMRSGEMVYLPNETPLIADSSGLVVITRTTDDICNPATISSFEGKPVTIEHPNNGDSVTPENWADLAVGIVQNVRAGIADCANNLIADLLITSRKAIHAVEQKLLRQVSCAYDAQLIQESPGRGRQEAIFGNHVALVSAGRCGPECAIFDYAPDYAPMNLNRGHKMKEKFMHIFQRVMDEALPDEKEEKEKDEASEMSLANMVSKLSARIDALEAKMVMAEKENNDLAADADKKTEATADAEAVQVLDADTIAKAEIIAPGIEKSGAPAGLKLAALKTAYATVDGRAIIEPLLAGRTLDSVDGNLLFSCVAQLIGGKRRAQMDAARITIDSLPTLGSRGPVSADQLNKINAEHFGKRRPL